MNDFYFPGHTLTVKLPGESLGPRDYGALLLITEFSFCCGVKGWAEIPPPKYKLEVLNLCSDEHWYNYLFTPSSI